MPFDNTVAIKARYVERLESQVEAQRVAIKMIVERGDHDAERSARASLSGLQRRIRELKRKVTDGD